jgi:hypothetical protein
VPKKKAPKRITRDSPAVLVRLPEGARERIAALATQTYRSQQAVLADAIMTYLDNAEAGLKNPLQKKVEDIGAAVEVLAQKASDFESMMEAVRAIERKQREWDAEKEAAQNALAKKAKGST